MVNDQKVLDFLAGYGYNCFNQVFFVMTLICYIRRLDIFVHCDFVMMFINSFRIFFSNFIQFWKTVLYKLIIVIFTILLLLPFLKTFMAVDFLPFLEGLKKLFLNFSFVNMSYYFEIINSIFHEIFAIVFNLFAINPACVIYSSVIVFVVFPFLLKLSDLALGEVVYGSMSSLTRVSFVGSFIKKIGKSSAYSILKTLISLPIFALTLYVEYLLVQVAVVSEVWLIFAPILMVLIFAFSFGLKESFLCGWLPSVIVFPCSVSSAFRKGIKVVARRYFRVLSTACCFGFIWIMLICLFGPLSNLIVLPIAYVLNIIFEMVMFFGSQGMRYYVDLDTILTPKRLEETDKITKAKEII